MGNEHNDTGIKLPTYAKASLLCIGFYVFIQILSIGQTIIVPLLYSIILAILLSNMVNFMVKKKVNRVLAIFLSILTAIVVLAILVSIVLSQAMRFLESMPVLIEKLLIILDQLTSWISAHFYVSTEKINTWILNFKRESMSYSSMIIGNSLTTAGNMLVVIFLIPVYVFMILFYQPLLVDFIHKVFGFENNENVSVILTQTKSVIQSYLSGLLIEGAIVAVLNSAGLLILGIDYAIVLGILCAILNFIPYIGGLIGIILCMVIAILTKSPVYTIYVLVLYLIIQLIDNHYIIPKIVSSKVKINALISIIVVLCGGALWGVPGMFLSIPLTAIIKLIFERIEGLKPWALLLGDTMPQIGKISLNFIKKMRAK